MAEIGGISVKLSADVDASGTVKGMSQIEAASDRIQQEFKETESVARSANTAIADSTTKTAAASKKATTAFKFQKGGMAQLGQQIQDVAVMSQFGADKFIILGTQGSQIASLFGPGGAVFGAVLAISAAIGGTLVNSINKAKEAGVDLPTELMGRLEEIKEKFLEVDEASRSAFLGVEFGKLNQEYEALAERIKVTEQRILEQSQAFNGNGNAVTTSLKKLEKLKQEQKDLAEVMEALTKVSTEDLAADGIDLSMEGGDNGIQKRVEAVRDGISKERELYEAWRQTKAAVTAGIISDEQAQLIQADIATQQRINANFESTKARLEEESKLLLENQTLTAEEKAARQAEIDAAALEADRIHKDLLKKQAIEYAQATADEEKAIEKNKMAAIQSMRTSVLQNFMNLLDRFAGESRVAAIAAIAINKGLALAQNTQNTLVAQTRALAELGPIAGPPVAAKIGAYGSINAGLIAATGLAQAAGLGGSSSSALTSSGGVAAVNTTSSVGGGSSSSQAINISLAGSANYTSADIYGLIDQLNEAASDGYTLNYSGG
jgi:archaellum component FlaC